MFNSDSWATIAANVQANKEATASVYSVGSEKEVLIGETNYTVRVANNSNYDCALDSKTACGFVVEFVDIVEKSAMNGSDTNVAGWPNTAMRTYLNGTFKSRLPSDLQSVIVDTTVISGHGSSNSNSARKDGNWESTDQIYLLSTGEIWSNCLVVDCNDTASYLNGATTTRQLDYYLNKGISTSLNYTNAVKKFNGTAAWWWLRTANSNNYTTFRVVYTDGLNNVYKTTYTGGVSPVFRIG